MKKRLINSTPGVWRLSLAALVLAVQACGGGGGGGEAGDGSPGTASSNSGQLTSTLPAAPAPAAPAVPAAPAPAPVTPESVAAAPAPLPPASPFTPVPVAPAPAPASTSAAALLQLTPQTSCSIPDLREAILKEINRARTDGHVCGTEILPVAAPVTWNGILYSAAARHSLDMASRNYFSHTSPEGVDFAQRVATEGYGWSAVGENLAAGQGSVRAVMQAWLGSDAHCRNIMNPIFTEVAVACVAQQGNYWTMELGRR